MRNAKLFINIIRIAYTDTHVVLQGSVFSRSNYISKCEVHMDKYVL